MALQIFCRRILPLLLIVLLLLAISDSLFASRTSSSSIAKGFVSGLIDQNGISVSHKRFFGKPAMVHFGFTHCPDVCPTTLNEVATLMTDLGPIADRINFVFVTVDPERDTADVLKSYIGHFDERIIGLTGSVEAVRALAKSFKTTFSKRPYDGGYSMDHAIFSYLKDSKWNTVDTLYIGAGASRTLMKKKLAPLLDEASSR